LVKTINDLAVLFKDLSDLVIEQGTILDRIDFNIAEAKEDVKGANEHLKKTVEIEKSSRSRHAIICLSVGILICVFILVLKMTY
jgi:syntaxin 16